MDPKDLWREIDRLKSQLHSMQRNLEQLEEKVHKKKTKGLTKESPPLGIPVMPVFQEPANLETTIGVRWMVVMGVIAVVIGLGYEVRIAIERGWINEQMRCLTAVFVGLVLLGTGMHLRKRYERFGEVLMSGGVVGVLLGIYTAHYLYHLINGFQALISILLVAFGSAILGAKAQAKAPVYIGLLGSYLAPFLVDNLGHSLFSFLSFVTILNFSYLLLSNAIQHMPLHILALYLSTALYCFAWYNSFHQDSSQWTTAFLYQVLQAISFGIVSVLPALFRKTPLSKENTWLLFPAVLLFYFLGGDLLIRYSEAWHIWFALGTAAFLFILAQAGRTRLKIKLQTHEASIMSSLVGLVIGSHLLFHNLEGLFLNWGLFLGLYVAAFLWIFFSKPKSIGYFLFGFSFYVLFKFCFFFGYEQSDTIYPFINSQFFMLGILGMSILFGMQMGKGFETSNNTMALVAHAIVLRALYLQVEFLHLGTTSPFVVTLAWVIYAAILLTLGLVKKIDSIRMASLWIFGVCTMKVFLYDTHSRSMMVKMASYMVLGISLIVAGYFYQRNKGRILKT